MTATIGELAKSTHGQDASTVTPATLMAAIRARGCVPHDLRDAVHEAHHALASKASFWSRRSIDRAVMAMCTVRAADDELLARVVEQDVCTRLGVSPNGTLEKWVAFACFEAAVSNIQFMPDDVAIERARALVETPRARRAADAVMALVVQVNRT